MPLYCTCAGDFEHTLTDKVSPLKHHWTQTWRQVLVNIVLMPVFVVFFSPPLVHKELRWTDCGVSEHSVPLQHDLLEGDDLLVTCHESKHLPAFSPSLNSIDGRYLKPGEPLHILGTKNWVCCYSYIYIAMCLNFIYLLLIKMFFNRWSSPEYFIAVSNDLHLILC